MPLTDEELRAVRSWVGESVTDEVLNERYDRLGDIDAAVEEELRSQAVALSQRPSNLALPSGLSVAFGQNMTLAEDRLKQFKASGGIGTPGVNVVKMHRRDFR